MPHDPKYTGPQGNSPEATAAYNTWLQANGKLSAPKQQNGYTYNAGTSSWVQPTQAPSSAPPQYQATATAPWNSGSSGLDFSKQGAGEQWWGTSGQKGYASPTAGEQWWNTYGGQYNQPSASESAYGAANSQIGPSYFQQWNASNPNPYGKQTLAETNAQQLAGMYGGGKAPMSSNNAQSYYSQYGGAPALSADLAPFYADAERRANEQINSQAAARGMYGSSYAADQGREAMVQLEAQRAKDEAQYGLSRAGELRNWEQLGGQLASSADQSSNNQLGQKLAWTTGIGNLLNTAGGLGIERTKGSQSLMSALDQDQIDRANAIMGIAGQADVGKLSRLGASQGAAMGAGAQDLSRLGGAMTGSSQAQGLQRQRGQDYLSNMGGLSSALSSILGSGNNGMISNDQTLMQGALDAILGRSSEALSQANQNRSQTQADIGNTIQMVALLSALA